MDEAEPKSGPIIDLVSLEEECVGAHYHDRDSDQRDLGDRALRWRVVHVGLVPRLETSGKRERTRNINRHRPSALKKPSRTVSYGLAFVASDPNALASTIEASSIAPE